MLSLSSGKSRKIPLHFAFWSFSQNSQAKFRIKSDGKLLDKSVGIPARNIRREYTLQGTKNTEYIITLDRKIGYRPAAAACHHGPTGERTVLGRLQR